MYFSNGCPPEVTETLACRQSPAPLPNLTCQSLACRQTPGAPGQLESQASQMRPAAGACQRPPGLADDQGYHALAAGRQDAAPQMDQSHPARQPWGSLLRLRPPVGASACPSMSTWHKQGGRQHLASWESITWGLAKVSTLWSWTHAHLSPLQGSHSKSSMPQQARPHAQPHRLRKSSSTTTQGAEPGIVHSRSVLPAGSDWALSGNSHTADSSSLPDHT